MCGREPERVFFFVFVYVFVIVFFVDDYLSPEVIMRGSQPERVEEVGLLSGLGCCSKNLEVGEVRNILYHRIVKTQPDKSYFHVNVSKFECN